MVAEMLVVFDYLTWLLDQEDFIMLIVLFEINKGLLVLHYICQAVHMRM